MRDLFFIRPYVHIALKRNHLLLYNTLNGKALEYRNKPAITRLVKQLISKDNLLVVRLSKKDLGNPGIREFITKARSYYIGDLLDSLNLKGKPIQMMPMLNVQKDISKPKSDIYHLGIEGMMSYFFECSVYINNLCELNCWMCKNAYKQFLICHKEDKQSNELDIEKIKSFFGEAKGSALSRINILGGNIFKYSKLKELVVFLNGLKMLKAYYIHYLNLEDQADNLALLANDSSEVNVLINFPVEQTRLSKVSLLFKNTNAKVKYIFTVEKNADLRTASHIAARLEIKDYLLKPYYNAKNMEFFKQNVFANKKDVLGAKPKMKEILSRMTVNAVYFGKLVILSDGGIYSNINASKLGELGRDSLYDVVYKEMTVERSWRRIRSQVQPCKRCIFDFLCPPLSNYEYAIGRNNLCHIWK